MTVPDQPKLAGHALIAAWLGELRWQLPTADLLNAIDQVAGFGSTSSLTSLLGLLELEPETRSPGIVQRLLARRLRSMRSALDEIRPAACRAIERLVQRTPIAELPRLDQIVRSVWNHYRGPNWEAIQRFADRPDGQQWQRTVYALASFHGDGRIRERALRELAQHQDGHELAYLIIRLNDWVEDIRTLAEQELLIRLQPGYARHVVANLPLFTRLDHLGRRDHIKVTSAVLGLLLSPDALPALLEGTGHANRRIRSLALSYITEAHEVPWESLLLQTAADRELSIRLWATQQISKHLPRQQAIDLLRSLGNDRHFAVRTEALRALFKLLGTALEANLRKALFDRAKTVRNFARYHLLQIKAAEDFAPVYRAALAADLAPQQLAAIAGLGETGSSADIALLEPFLEHERPQLVKQTLTALQRLAPIEARHLIAGMLADQRASICKHAARLLTPALTTDDLAAIERAIQNQTPGEVRMPLIWLAQARTLGAWPRLRLLLAFTALPKSPLAQAVQTALLRWCHGYEHSLYAPRAAQRGELEHAEQRLKGLSLWCTPGLIHKLRAILQKQGPGPGFSQTGI